MRPIRRALFSRPIGVTKAASFKSIILRCISGHGYMNPTYQSRLGGFSRELLGVLRDD